MRRILGGAAGFSIAALALGAAPGVAAPECYGEPATIVGTSDKDKINGTAGRDVIVALGGDDVVHGGPGNDVICLGPNPGTGFRERAFGDKGHDRVSGGRGSESLYGGRGRDFLSAGGGSRNVAIGGPGDDELVGGQRGDLLGGEGGPGGGGSSSGGGYEYEYTPGEPGDDLILGRGGDDRLIAGAGDDTMEGGSGVDRVAYWSTERGDYFADLETGRASGAGRDTLKGVEDLHAWTKGDIVLRGDRRPNVLLGSPSLDTAEAAFYGGGADDLLVGQQGSDVRRAGDLDLYGGLGNDALIGQCVQRDDATDELFAGPGADQILLGCGLRIADGGPGNDEFEAAATPDSVVHYSGGEGFDLISFEFSGARIEADLREGLISTFYGGTPGSTHTLGTIEGLIAGDGTDDVLLGDDGPNVLMGGSSPLDAVLDDDRIEGYGGDDEIHGDDGNDDLDGGEGEDLISGGEGVDTCHNGESVNGCEVT